MAKQKPKRINNVRLAGMLILTGVAGLVFALLILIIGLWIDDNLIGRRGLATIVLLVVSVPLNIYMMIKMAVWLTDTLRPLHTDSTIDYDEEV